MGVHKTHGTNGNDAAGCILYQTRALIRIRTVILIQCVSGLPFLFCTPQPSKGLDIRAFLAAVLLSAVCLGADKYRPGITLVIYEGQLHNSSGNAEVGVDGKRTTAERLCHIINGIGIPTLNLE